MMKIKLILLLLSIVMLNACKVNAPFLPSYQNIDTNQYGSLITVYQLTTSQKIKGELIQIDSNSLTVLSENEYNKGCKVIPLSSIYKFKLRYAKPSANYAWTIPGFVLLPFIHGLYSAFTMPLHLIVTIAVTATGQNEFQYNNQNITFEQLKMFARFPQGVPPEIQLDSIK